MDKDKNEDTLTRTIIQLIESRKPENVEQLVNFAKERTSIPEQEIVERIIRLQSQGKIILKEQPTIPLQKLGTYLKSKHAYWYWITIVLVIATVFTVFAIPENSYPLIYIRYILGTIFVLWLPGYSFAKVLFSEPPTKTSSRTLDFIERFALSVGMSLALVATVGLILNYTPWGIRLTPVVLALLSLTIIFATAAIIRGYQTKNRTIT